MSSLAMAELADALGLQGFEGHALQGVGAAVTSKFVSNAWTFATNGGTGNLLSGFDPGGMGGSLAGAFGTSLGSAAAGNILAPANATAATFSSFTSMAGSFAATWGMAQIVGAGMAALTSFIPFIGPLIGTFVGQLVGTHAGNLWFDTDDRASAILKVDEATGRYHVAQWTQWDGGQTSMAGLLADAVIAGMDGLAAANENEVDWSGRQSYVFTTQR